MTNFVIVDTETTGLGKTDRVTEVAAIVYDADRDLIVDEYDTLINPMRDIGPTDIHGLTPSMVSAAPTFEEAAGVLATKIDGSILVAHNLIFDLRMLSMEYDRLGAHLDPGTGICTLRLSGMNLSRACEKHGIELTSHHRALADARAATELLRRLLDDDNEVTAAAIHGLDAPLNTRTLRRDVLGTRSDVLPLARMVNDVRFPTTDDRILSYLNALDWVLDDLVIEASEQEQLTNLAQSLGIGADELRRAHHSYFRSLVIGAQRDGIITKDEHSLLETVAGLLGIDDVAIPEINDRREVPAHLPSGARVCFTGTAVVEGQPISRIDVEETAAFAGLQPVQSVTKQTELLVCADPASMSSKTTKARKYGIPIMSFEEFIGLVGYVEIA